MQLRPDRTMSTKHAAKAPAKKAAKVKPLIFSGPIVPTLSEAFVAVLLSQLPVIRLKELLRERGLLIPRDKVVMVERLAAHLARPEGRFQLTLS